MFLSVHDLDGSGNNMNSSWSGLRHQKIYIILNVKCYEFTLAYHIEDIAGFRN